MSTPGRGRMPRNGSMEAEPGGARPHCHKAGSWHAIAASLAEGVMDQLVIITQRTDQRMLAHEVELPLLHLLAFLPLEQLAKRPQSIGPMRDGNGADAINRGAGMTLGQAQQPLQDAHSFDA